MDEPYIGTIILWAPDFAPRGWAFCHGQLLTIPDNASLFSLLGTRYGGDGRTTFGLPDLRSRVPVGVGQGPGLSPCLLGQPGGTERVALSANQMPAHAHPATPSLNVALEATTEFAGKSTPASDLVPGTVVDAKGTDISVYSDSTPNTTLKASAVTGSVTVGNAGANQAHENRQPFLGLNYIIALQGLYPPRN